MPGMMDTVLNLGLNDACAAGLAARSGDERFAYDAYRWSGNGCGDACRDGVRGMGPRWAVLPRSFGSLRTQSSSPTTRTSSPLLGALHHSAHLHNACCNHPLSCFSPTSTRHTLPSRRFLDMYGDVVMGIPHHLFEEQLERLKVRGPGLGLGLGLGWAGGNKREGRWAGGGGVWGVGLGVRGARSCHIVYGMHGGVTEGLVAAGGPGSGSGAWAGAECASRIPPFSSRLLPPHPPYYGLYWDWNKLPPAAQHGTQAEQRVSEDTALTAADLRTLVARYKEVYKQLGQVGVCVRGGCKDVLKGEFADRDVEASRIEGGPC